MLSRWRQWQSPSFGCCWCHTCSIRSHSRIRSSSSSCIPTSLTRRSRCSTRSTACCCKTDSGNKDLSSSTGRQSTMNRSCSKFRLSRCIRSSSSSCIPSSLIRRSRCSTRSTACCCKTDSWNSNLSSTGRQSKKSMATMKMILSTTK
jgi:hypothetical protein